MLHPEVNVLWRILDGWLFQRAPTLGGECYPSRLRRGGGSATAEPGFQRAPTLGGECYLRHLDDPYVRTMYMFQRAPTLGGECYIGALLVLLATSR